MCNLNEIIKDTEKMLPRLVGEHITVKTGLAENLHNVYADRGNLDQALINLAVNARDAMPNGGRISISTRNTFIDEKWGAFAEKFLPGEYVEIAFSDTGSGIPEEIQDKIFDPFFTTKGIGKGTGLGLSTIFGIITQHNGYIKCYSEEGIGTTFKIYLPRHEGKIEESVITLLEAEMPRGSESILVVEDSEEVRNLTVAVLSRLGYQVFKAADGGEAYTFCEMVTTPVDLVLTDVIMPAMNGVEFEEHVRNIWPDTKVLFMTGYTADVVSEYLRPDKNYIFLNKPFVPQELAQKVREVLDMQSM
ncbi:MAG: response regulator [FCB group bacterium]|nr:response regulator [FCB group bacterium]